MNGCSSQIPSTQTHEKSRVGGVRGRLSGLARLALAVPVFAGIGLTGLGLGASAAHAEMASGQDSEPVVIRVPMTTSGPRSLDPAFGSSTYDNRAVVQVYETLLQYSYFKRPLELEPLLLTEMPEVLDGGLRYRFTLRDDIYFQDDECFPNGKGRRLVTDDVFYSWKRLADPEYRLQNWARVAGMIKGFDAYKDEQGQIVADGGEFDYEVPVEGMVKISDTEFEVILPDANRQFLWKIATFQMAIVPREAVDFYGDKINSTMVGTGPFRLVEWVPGTKITFERNPTFRDEYYPTEMSDEDRERGWDEPIGRKLPLADRVEVTFFVETSPMWLEFKTGQMDHTTVPEAGFEEAFTSRGSRVRLDREWRLKGIDYQPVPLMDFIYRGFNMDDELVGGYTPDKIALRRALAMCMDIEEINRSRYNNIPLIYDGIIPPGVDGHLPAGSFDPPNRGPDFARARELLVEAGYTVVDGKVTDLPPIDLYTARGADSEKIVEMFNRNLSQVGIEINPRYVDFAKLTEVLDNSQAPMFSLAWGSAYPDAEYNLQLFYGPNKAPLPNQFNFVNAEYDDLYRQIKVMAPGPERTAAYNRMQEIINEYCVFIGSQARVRQYVIHPWMKNFKATETFYNYFKYIDIDMDHPDRPE
jgi:oligopeptide transport system substrate-binding protein